MNERSVNASKITFGELKNVEIKYCTSPWGLLEFKDGEWRDANGKVYQVEIKGAIEMTAFEPVELGDRVRDPITGFKGIAHCMTVWLNGCIRIGVLPESLDKDGKVQDDRYFDQGSLVVIKKSVHRPLTLAVTRAPKQTRQSNGGPARETGNYRR